jgi:hypothetical protein
MPARGGVCTVRDEHMTPNQRDMGKLGRTREGPRDARLRYPTGRYNGVVLAGVEWFDGSVHPGGKRSDEAPKANSPSIAGRFAENRGLVW